MEKIAKLFLSYYPTVDRTANQKHSRRKLLHCANRQLGGSRLKRPCKACAHSFGGMAKQRTAPTYIFGGIVTLFWFYVLYSSLTLLCGSSSMTKKADREIKNALFQFLKTVNRKVWGSEHHSPLLLSQLSNILVSSYSDVIHYVPRSTYSHTSVCKFLIVSELHWRRH